jgi:hypothetical protein
MQQLVRRLPGVVSTWVGSASFAPDFYESAKQAAAALPESDTSLAAERLRRHRAQPSRLADGRWRPHPAPGAMA